MLGIRSTSRRHLAALALLTGLCTTARADLVAVTAVAQLSQGFDHACAIVAGGALECWGNNADGELGTGDKRASATPIPVTGMRSGVTAVSAGKAHTCAVLNGGAYCWGYNFYGQLGDGSEVSRLTPVPVSGLSSGVTAISAGDFHTCAIVNGGALCWGNNDFGQLGAAVGDGSLQPVAVSGLSSGVSALSSGVLHTCAVVAGAAKCWGDNISGQVGNGSSDSVVPTPVDVFGLSSGVVSISAGAVHSCAAASGSLHCWGANDLGQLGDGTGESSGVPVVATALPPMVAVATGASHTCGLSNNGALFCWGENTYGTLGDGSSNDSLQPVVVAGLPGAVAAVSARGYFSCARFVDGSAKCWGLNDSGQLGDGSAVIRTAPVAVNGLASGVTSVAAGFSHTCAVANGTTQCWGYNGSGALGNGALTLYNSLPNPVIMLNANATALAAGDDHACAVVAGAVKCWGSNHKGQLGNASTVDSTTPVQVSGLLSGVSAVAASGNQTCAIQNGRAVCWGYNGDGELGNGSTLDSSVPLTVKGLVSGVTAISVGTYQACAVVNGGAVCWGDAFFGGLGDGSTQGFSALPVQVSGLTSGVSAIGAGTYHACAVSNGAVKCWGYNGYGDLGNGSVIDSPIPIQVSGLTGSATAVAVGDDISCAIVAGSTLCWGGDYYGDLGNGGVERSRSLVPVPVLGLSNFSSAISTGGNQVCAIFNGGLKCWGNDYLGQLGVGRAVASLLPLSVVRDDQIFHNEFD